MGTGKITISGFNKWFKLNVDDNFKATKNLIESNLTF